MCPVSENLKIRPIRSNWYDSKDRIRFLTKYDVFVYISRRLRAECKF